MQQTFDLIIKLWIKNFLRQGKLDSSGLSANYLLLAALIYRMFVYRRYKAGNFNGAKVESLLDDVELALDRSKLFNRSYFQKIKKQLVILQKHHRLWFFLIYLKSNGKNSRKALRLRSNSAHYFAENLQLSHVVIAISLAEYFVSSKPFYAAVNQAVEAIKLGYKIWPGRTKFSKEQGSLLSTIIGTRGVATHNYANALLRSLISSYELYGKFFLGNIGNSENRGSSDGKDSRDSKDSKDSREFFSGAGLFSDSQGRALRRLFYLIHYRSLLSYEHMLEPWWRRSLLDSYSSKEVLCIRRHFATSAYRDIAVKSTLPRQVWQQLENQSDVEVIFDSDDLRQLRVTSHIDLAKLVGFDRGDFWVQNTSARLLRYFLSLFLEQYQGRELAILDAFAGKGGKTVDVLDLIKSRQASLSSFLACDIDASSIQVMQKNLQRLDYSDIIDMGDTGDTGDRRCLKIIQQDFKYLDTDGLGCGRNFDWIILDVPCTGSGTLHKYPFLASKIDGSFISYSSDRQLEFLNHASRLLRKGGLIAYSTCSLFRSENEDVIARFLSSSNHFRVGDFEVALDDGTSKKIGSIFNVKAMIFGYQVVPRSAFHFVDSVALTGSSSKSEANESEANELQANEGFYCCLLKKVS